MRRTISQAKLVMLDTLALDADATQDKLAGVDIHRRIKSHRIKLGLSQQQLADRISQIEGLKKPLAWQTVQQWETKTAPKRERLQHVAQVLGLTVEDLLDLPKQPAAPLVQEQTANYGPAWPFKFIQAEQISRLPPSQLAALERVIVSHLLQPNAVDWRAHALDLASFLDHKNKDDSFSRFVRAVDLKAEVANTAPLPNETPA